MTTLSPLLEAPVTIQLHAASALAAALIGPFALFRQRRDRLHKALGYVWVAAMAVAASSSFLIHGLPVIGPFGPIHLLSAWTLVALALGVRFAMQGRIAAHRGMMRSLYFWALGVAGLFTLLPGRIMHRVIFGADTLSGFMLIGGAAVLIWLLTRGSLRQRGA